MRAYIVYDDNFRIVYVSEFYNAVFKEVATGLNWVNATHPKSKDVMAQLKKFNPIGFHFGETVYVKVKSQPDKEGRQSFDLSQMSDYIGIHKNETGMHTQGFFASLAQHIEKLESEGYKVVFE